MKKKCLLLATALVVAWMQPVEAQIKLGGRNIDVKKAVAAGSNVVSAVTLSDEDVAKLSRESVALMDQQNSVAGETSDYAIRLKKLTANITSYDGLNLNYKVYLVKDINAFACGDGSVRIFSALMDQMTDDELMAIIGHEIGHVKGTDSKEALKNAYIASATRNAAGAVGGTVDKLTSSQLATIVQAFSNAQFSQKQEYAADDYSFRFCTDNGVDPYAMSNSLKKLVDLSNGGKASLLQKMFSSHPDSEKRSLRMKEKADQYSRK